MFGSKDTKGLIFNIQFYSIHDGPGIRTTVFMKGCPLRCIWCQNPESQNFSRELFFEIEKCNGCALCVHSCPAGAIGISDAKLQTNRNKCTACGKCVELCCAEARMMIGKIVTAEEVFREAAKDNLFYQRSGGGVTLSGGEPLAQPEFAISILRRCKDAGIHVVVDTCGHADWQIAKEVLRHADLVLYDLKHMDAEKHKQMTGVSNELILDNARRICHELAIPMLVRLPLIPGYNDAEENIKATAQFVSTELHKNIKLYLLPYHKLGATKFERLERKCLDTAIEPPTAEHMHALHEMVLSYSPKHLRGG